MAKISQTTSHEDSASDSEGWTAINIPSSTPESTSAVPLTESTDFPMPPQASFTSLLTRPRT